MSAEFHKALRYLEESYHNHLVCSKKDCSGSITFNLAIVPNGTNRGTHKVKCNVCSQHG